MNLSSNTGVGMSDFFFCAHSTLYASISTTSSS